MNEKYYQVVRPYKVSELTPSKNRQIQDGVAAPHYVAATAYTYAKALASAHNFNASNVALGYHILEYKPVAIIQPPKVADWTRSEI